MRRVGLTLLALGLGASAQALLFRPQALSTTASFRGLSVVNAQVVWASGTGGTIVRTDDWGTHWQMVGPPATSQLDFRDIKALNAQLAYAAAIGPNGGIFKTVDGGRHWREQYASHNPKFFLDGLAFWDARHGLALGDPMNGRFLVLRTTDGGRHWRQVVTLPAALPNEGAFAASGTSLLCQPHGWAWFATGGAASGARVFRTSDQGLTWQVATAPLGGDGAGAGIFSLAFASLTHGLAAGGNYEKPTATSRTLAKTDDGGASWQSGADLGGYRSAVAAVPGTPGTWVAVGPSGTDVSTDDGWHWIAVPAAPPLNTVAFAPDGSGWAVGPHGRIEKLLIPPRS